MQHFLFPAPLPPPLPPPPPGRGTILSQEARLHALQIAEEIQAERGSYRKWNEVAKAVNRQYGSNVDGDLVKRQVTSMLRSVQRSGVNSVKRPRKHAEVIQQLLEPGTTNKRQQGPDGQILRIEGAEDEDKDDNDDGGARMIPEDTENNTPTITETTTTTTPPQSPKNTTTTETSPSSSSTTTDTTTTTTTPSLSDSVKNISSSEQDTKTETTRLPAESHSIERVTKPRKIATEKQQQQQQQQQQQHHHHMMALSHPPQGTLFSPPLSLPPPPPSPRIVPNMSVDEVYALVSRLHPDIDAEFIRTQEIDGSAFQTLSHRELTDFGVPTFGKRNKLLQLCISFDSQQAPPTPVPQEPYFVRLPPAFPPYMDPKGEMGDKDMKDGTIEKKPPVTKILDMEVVGVRKRYLIERENGSIEVLTPCKLRKYKSLTSAFEHIHPDKLVPIPTFSVPFTHVPPSDDSKSSDSSFSSSSSSAAGLSSSSSSLSSSPSPVSPKKSKSSKSAASAAYIPPSGYYPVFYSSTASYPVMSPSSSSPSNLQWIHSPYPGISSQRTPEKYHSFHPYHPPK